MATVPKCFDGTLTSSTLLPLEEMFRLGRHTRGSMYTRIEVTNVSGKHLAPILNTQRIKDYKSVKDFDEALLFVELSRDKAHEHAYANIPCSRPAFKKFGVMLLLPNKEKFWLEAETLHKYKDIAPRQSEAGVKRIRAVKSLKERCTRDSERVGAFFLSASKEDYSDSKL
jgi:hypothetical protein